MSNETPALSLETILTAEERAAWPQLTEYERRWLDPPLQPEHSGSQKGDGGRSFTAETIADSISRLTSSQIDPKIKAIINDIVSPYATPEETVEVIRNTIGLREDLARYFLSKLRKSPLKVAHRVALNTQKSPGHTGYPPSMYSQDYAALLAISKLDGTFNERLSAEGGTLPQYDSETGISIRGQHQAAAEFLLKA